MLFEKKANLKKIQTLMGHTNIETTLNVYGHLLEENGRKDDEPVGMLGSLLQNSCGVSVAQVTLKLLICRQKIFLGKQNVASSIPVTRPFLNQ